ncbi:MAG: PhzF family phenazine biosynthesis isomerase [Clostridia bacterium]|nr:PhzF family phenazine biosynthesis isomerase [Clostridia bacterium]
MKKVKVYHYDAFTKTAGKGNPAGIIIEAKELNTEEMQEIARQIGFSECAFILPSDKADLRLRYFTPGAEVNLCGHATIASVYALFKKTPQRADLIQKTVETKAGIIDIAYNPENQEVTMSQADAQFLAFEGDKAALVHSIGLQESDLDQNLPIVYGSTGLWTLILPIQKLEAFSRMKPNNALFSSILKELPNASIHPICTETLKTEAVLHGRHFSPAISGRVEDPITGTACGVMGAYYISYLHPLQENCDLLIEQGQDAGYDGIVHVWAHKEEKAIKVKIAGTAIEVAELSAEVQ